MLNFIEIGSFCHPGGAKLPILTTFQIQHSVVAPLSGVETKLNASVQLQIFPIKWYRNRFYTPTPWWWSFSHTSLVKSM